MDTPPVKDVFPSLQEAQATYLGAIDSLQHPDRRTHELVRLACSVISRHQSGVRHHAMLAAEMGATWEDIAGTLVLTQPSFGLVPSVEALDAAREGFEAAAVDATPDDDPDD